MLLERDRVAAQALRAGPLTWPGAEGVRLLETDALFWLLETDQMSDLMLVDPPFESNLLAESLVTLAGRPGCLNPGGMVYVECAPEQIPTVWPTHLEIWKQKQLGQVLMTLLKRCV